MSLDGFIAGPNGEADWIIMDPEIDFKAIWGQFETLVMGRRPFRPVYRRMPFAPDLAVLAWAAAENRVFVTNDRNTMVGFAHQPAAAGEPGYNPLDGRSSHPTVLIDCVEGGASVSFLAPLARDKAAAF
jgi:hypothetical protein